MEAVAGSGATGEGSARIARSLVFVGFMGAGKSSAARVIAPELGATALDSDRLIEAQLGEPIAAFFDRVGEAEFRALEERVVLELLGRPDAGVVALGGGALGSAAVQAALAAHTVVALEVEPDQAWRRASGKGRPLARDRARFDELHAERRALYASVADAILPPGGRELAYRALPALTALRDLGPGVRLLWARSASGDYPVFVGRGLIERGFVFGAPRRIVVSDERVAALHQLGGDVAQLTIPPGESSKTLAQAENLLRELARAGASGEDTIVALGGGVVGDLAGFCASVYRRGIPVAQVPTTLVAQVDSAFGGKTGVDLPEAKNYVGAFHQPVSVTVDPAALETLPKAEIGAGFAEVVKTALIAGEPLWARVRSGEEIDEQTILDCIRTKLEVVGEDERDAGRRQVLNLGHTVGHAVEAATGYGTYRHGEAVAIGLMAALRLSGQDRLREEVGELLAARGLPLGFSGPSTNEVVELVARDKKGSRGKVPFVLVEQPGRVTHGHTVSGDALRAAIEEVRVG